MPVPVLNIIIAFFCFVVTNVCSGYVADSTGDKRLALAINNPEYMLKNWIELPSANIKSIKKLSLRDAILLSLRYNPNIQNAELDRVIQRYQLQIAKNEFELQYALAGSANYNVDRYEGVGKQSSHQAIATPEIKLKNFLGTSASLSMNNQVETYDNYHPVLNFSLTQPLLRNFGSDVNLAALRNAKDNERLNQLTLRQSVMDQITNVISSYNTLVQTLNSYNIQLQQLSEAKQTYKNNNKKIKAGKVQSFI